MPVLSFLTTLTVNKTDQKGHGDIVVAPTPFQPAAGTQYHCMEAPHHTTEATSWKFSDF